MPGDFTIDVSSMPYESGFKFNTLPFGGMTIDTNNAVRIGSASDIKLVPPSGNTVIVGTTGGIPDPSAALRGAIFVIQSDSGTADMVKICVKDGADAYVWMKFSIAP